MRRVVRKPLSEATQAALARLTERVRAAAKPAEEADARWRSKPDRVFDDLRSTLHAMAPGRARCMYCEDGQGTDIDHFRPKSRWPELTFTWENHLLACSACNSNHKRDRFPLDEHGGALLIDPTAEDPRDHLLFLPATGRFQGLTRKGDATIEVFGLNEERPPRLLVRGRKGAIIRITTLLWRYDYDLDADPEEAALLRQVLLDEPFSGVLHWLVATAHEPGGTKVLGKATVDLVVRHDVASWLSDGA